MKFSPHMVLLIVFVIIVFNVGPSAATDSRNPDSAVDFYRTQKQMADQWDSMASESNKEWAGLRQKAEANWTDYVQSTQKKWVAYDRAMQTRSKVNFENGEIEIETVLPEDGSKGIEEAAEKIAASVKNILSENAHGRSDDPREPNQGQQRSAG